MPDNMVRMNSYMAHFHKMYSVALEAESYYHQQREASADELAWLGSLSHCAAWSVSILACSLGTYRFALALRVAALHEGAKSYGIWPKAWLPCSCWCSFFQLQQRYAASQHELRESRSDVEELRARLAAAEAALADQQDKGSE